MLHAIQWWVLVERLVARFVQFLQEILVTRRRVPVTVFYGGGGIVGVAVVGSGGDGGGESGLAATAASVEKSWFPARSDERA